MTPFAMSAANETDRRAPAQSRVPTLPPAIAEAERRETHGRSGRLSYYVAGAGTPMLLIHSINAAPSAYEVRPIFESMQATRRVFAVDLPGFGFSDRSARDYGVPLFVAAIFDMLDVIAADAGDVPVDALALSLGCEFLARAATEAPAPFRTLSFVGPTGMSDRDAPSNAPAGATREVAGLQRLLRFPLWRQPIYDLLVSRPSVRYFLERTWGSKNIDEGVFDYAYLTAHQPGACNAPLAFVSGRLFSRDILRIYESLQMPVWVTRGTRGDFQDLRQLPRLERRTNWRAQTFDTGAMPHFERRSEFMDAFLRFVVNPSRNDTA